MTKLKKRQNGVPLLLFTAVCVACVSANRVAEPHFNFSPPKEAYVTESQTVDVTLNIVWNLLESSSGSGGLLFVQVKPQGRAEILSNASMRFDYRDLIHGAIKKLTLKGISMGHAKLEFFWKADDHNQSTTTTSASIWTTITRTINTSTIMNDSPINLNATAVWSNVNATTDFLLSDIETSTSWNYRDEADVTQSDPSRKWKNESRNPGNGESGMKKPASLIRNIMSTAVGRLSAGDTTNHRESREAKRRELLEQEQHEKPAITNSVQRQELPSRSARSGVLNVQEAILLSDAYQVHVTRKQGTMDDVLLILLGVCIVAASLMTGCRVQPSIMLEVLRKPRGPIACLICQFAILPLVSYGFGEVLLLSDQSHLKFGLLLTTSLAGGILKSVLPSMIALDGDTKRGVTTTFISIVCSMIMTPMWMATLGQRILVKGDMTVPLSLSSLVEVLVTIFIVAIIGVVIEHVSPGWSKKMRRVIRPFFVAMATIALLVAGFTSTFLFTLMTWRVIFAALCVGWSGVAIGAAFAWTCRLTRPEIITVSTSVAIQNAGTAFFVLRLILRQPDADLASVVPAVQLMVTCIPLLAGHLLTSKLRESLKRRDRKVEELQRSMNDIDAIEPLVINRNSAGPALPPKRDPKTDLPMTTASEIKALPTDHAADTAVLYANMYGDCDDTYYGDTASKSKPRLELKLSRDAGVRYDVPKFRMHTFEDADFDDQSGDVSKELNKD